MSKHSHLILLAASAVALFNFVSCRNAGKTDSQKPSEQDSTKVELAQEVLSYIDSLAGFYAATAENYEQSAPAFTAGLTDREKMVKPEYLLDPRMANQLITRNQKINALAILITERPIRLAYGLPVDATDEAMAKLAADLHHSVPFDNIRDKSASDCIREHYEDCRSNGDLAYFWKFTFALQCNLIYLISENCDRFFDNVTDEQYDIFFQRWASTLKAAKLIAEYDSEMAGMMDIYDKYSFIHNDEALAGERYGTRSAARENTAKRRDAFEHRRSEMLR